MTKIKKRFILLDEAIRALKKGAKDENAPMPMRESYNAIAEHLEDLQWLKKHHAQVEGEVMRLRTENADLKKQLAEMIAANKHIDKKIAHGCAGMYCEICDGKQEEN